MVWGERSETDSGEGERHVTAGLRGGHEAG